LQLPITQGSRPVFLLIAYFSFMKTILISCFCFCSLLSVAQFKESFYALDGNWQQTDEKNAKFLLWIHLDSATSNWAYSYYHMWGSQIKTETYKDHDGKVLNGLCCYYYTSGDLDSVGHYKDGKKEGKFYRYALLPNDSLKQTMRYEYANDSLISAVDPAKDSLRKIDLKDSVNNRESAFPGGVRGWQYYLQHHLQYPDRAIDHEIQGKVIVDFIIDEQGDISEPVIWKSVEYSLDREAMRMVQQSGKWLPALYQGNPVLSYKKQPVVFRMEVSK
jgi:protein TonB